jgi:Family of unknown function (DUF5924)
MSEPNLEIGRPAPIYRFSFVGWCRRHQEKLWWLHSLYALLLGIGVMWLGKRNFAYVRVAVIHLSFIWLSSLILPKLLNHPRLAQRWASKLQLVVNFFNKNFYQQMLFFVLPIYYASTTLGSLNVVFVMLVGLSALLSTLDLIYDRHLSVRRNLAAGFFAFNLFALINVMLPILWSVSNTQTTRISGVLAFAGFLSLAYPASQSIIRRLALVFGIGLIILGVVELGRAFIPPAPLRLASAEFGTNFERESFQIVSPLIELNSAGPLQLNALTAIKAPLGLKEKLQHRWYENGKLVCASPFYNVVGGREEGFRLWTGCAFSNIPPHTKLRLDVETEGGQLVGRAKLKAGS